MKWRRSVVLMDVHCSSRAEGSRSGKQDAESALAFTSGRILDQLAVVGMKCEGGERTAELDAVDIMPKVKVNLPFLAGGLLSSKYLLLPRGVSSGENVIFWKTDSSSPPHRSAPIPVLDTLSSGAAVWKVPDTKNENRGRQTGSYNAFFCSGVFSS